jgi:hypothetical protein
MQHFIYEQEKYDAKGVIENAKISALFVKNVLG